jgi:hypothetical protein
MIVEFLGQGLYEDESETIGNYICSSFKEELFAEITVFVAFLRKSGISILRPYIEKALEQGKKITFYVGIDERVTSKDALELLNEIGVETYIYFSDKYIYHPKVFIFQGIKNRIIIGSTNITKAGLLYNVETSILLDFTENDKSGLKVLSQLKEYYKPLLEFTDSNLDLSTQEKIEELLEKGLISKEEFDSNENSNFKKIHDNFKKGKKQINEVDFGNIEIKKNQPYRTYDTILKITDEYLEKWDTMFERMKLFYQENDHCTVTNGYKDRTLYGWYRKQKALYNNNLMPKEHIEKLKTINFYFGDSHTLTWDRKWLESYNKLLAIYHETGNANLKRIKDKDHPWYSLSNWIAWERGKYHKTPRTIKDWQIEKLEDIGFKWVIGNVVNQEKKVDDWLVRVAQLEDYKKKFGDCNVSQTNRNKEYKSLGKWLNDQRNAYKKQRLDKEKIELLESLGIIWNMDVHNFELKIKQLLEYKEEFGDFNVPVAYKKDPSFGNYIYKLKTNGIKEKWKIERLHKIGFHSIGIMPQREKKGHITLYWYKMLDELKSINTLNTEEINSINPKLAKWFENQKKAFRHKKLKDEQIEELVKLGVELETESKTSKKWNDFIELIELFIKEYGHSEVTEEFDKELFLWIKQQKEYISAKKLRKEKIRKLKDLGIIKNEL